MTSHTFHFLHIGKTGGSALINAVRAVGAAEQIHLHRHHIRLPDVPKGEPAFFFLRDPVTRFTSGFFSRFREGRPLTYHPWKEEEIVAFTAYTTPNALAEDLLNDDAEARARAEAAMGAIGHVNSSFYDWVISDDYFEQRKSDIAYVGFQETYASDFERLREMGILPATSAPPEDAVLAHRTPDGFDRHLSERAVSAIADWYARDFDFYRKCAAWRAERWPDAEPPPSL